MFKHGVACCFHNVLVQTGNLDPSAQCRPSSSSDRVWKSLAQPSQNQLFVRERCEPWNWLVLFATPTQSRAALPGLFVPILESHAPFFLPSLRSFRVSESGNADGFCPIVFKDVPLRVDVVDKAVTVELQRHGIAVGHAGVVAAQVIVVLAAGGCDGSCSSVVWFVLIRTPTGR